MEQLEELESDLLSAKEAARAMSVPLRKIYRLIKSGDLAWYKLGTRTYRVRRGDLLAFQRRHLSLNPYREVSEPPPKLEFEPGGVVTIKDSDVEPESKEEP